MADEIGVVEREGFHALCVSVEVGMMKIPKVVKPAYEEIMRVMKERQLSPPEGGVPFILYPDVEWSCFDKKGVVAMVKMLFFQKMRMDIGIPCAEPTTASGRVIPLEVAPGRFVRALHRGAYRNVPKTYDLMRAYVAEEGLVIGDFSLERYLNDPRTVSEAELETEVLVPVV